MAIKYFFNEPENVLCVKIKVPVVLAEEEVQVTVDNVTSMPELAKKIDHIDARLDDFRARPIFLHEHGDRWISVIEQEGWERFGWKFTEHRQPVVKKVLIRGTLHKQVFYVDKNDHVKHFGEDIPFAKEVTIDDPQPVVSEDDVFVQLHHKKIDMRWDLRRGSRLEQVGVLIFAIKVVEERQIFVQVCPRLDRDCARGVNLVKDGGFDAWATDKTPVFWGASNVENANGGALMGANPTDRASLFQTISNNIVPTGQYRLCFDATEVTPKGACVSSFTLTAEIAYYDRFGRFISGDSQTYTTSQINDNHPSRLCLNSTAPEGTKEALVRFTFEPTYNNCGQVIIDNVMLECLRVMKDFFKGDDF